MLIRYDSLNNIDFKKLEHGLVIMDESGWHTEEIANDFKCQCNQTFSLFSRAKPYRTSMALVEATRFIQPIFYGLRRHYFQVCDAWNRLWIAPKESPKCDREDG